jgi:hypothetical protein
MLHYQRTILTALSPKVYAHSMAVKIDDVASRAKVSIKTVSRVVNHEPHVRAELRARVEKAMHELGYSPNIAAKRLASNRAFAIGLLYGGAPGEYFSQILHSILEFSTSAGYTVIVSNFIPLDASSRAHVFEMSKRKMVDGLILTPTCDNDRVLLEQLSEAAIPFVRLTPADTSSLLPYVAADDRQGAAEMTEYLIRLGHRRIGFVYGDPKHHASEERYRGFVETLHGHGFEFDPLLQRVRLPLRPGRSGGTGAPRPRAAAHSHLREQRRVGRRRARSRPRAGHPGAGGAVDRGLRRLPVGTEDVPAAHDRAAADGRDQHARHAPLARPHQAPRPRGASHPRPHDAGRPREHGSQPPPLAPGSAGSRRGAFRCAQSRCFTRGP